MRLAAGARLGTREAGYGNQHPRQHHAPEQVRLGRTSSIIAQPSPLYTSKSGGWDRRLRKSLHPAESDSVPADRGLGIRESRSSPFRTRRDGAPCGVRSTGPACGPTGRRRRPVRPGAAWPKSSSTWPVPRATSPVADVSTSGLHRGRARGKPELGNRHIGTNRIVGGMLRATRRYLNTTPGHHADDAW
jgi:hypothetical protein